MNRSLGTVPVPCGMLPRMMNQTWILSSVNLRTVPGTVNYSFVLFKMQYIGMYTFMHSDIILNMRICMLYKYITPSISYYYYRYCSKRITNTGLFKYNRKNLHIKLL